jgi:carnitine 3-dehydrogenase
MLVPAWPAEDLHKARIERRVGKGIMAETSETIAIIGCGLIGESWSALFTAYGHDVTVWDPALPALAPLLERVESARRRVRGIGAQNTKKEGHLHIAATLEEAVATASWIQENAPESVPLKRELYGRIGKAAPADAVIASSTSSLTWSELAQDMRHPWRFITAHPFNPPHIMPLVEIFARSDAIRERAVSFYRALGRTTVELKRDAVGHIANRLSSALWREAVNIVAEGIADVSSVDVALVNGPGLRWSVIGAHMAYHLGGGRGGMAHYLEHLGASQERRWATLGTPSLTPEVRAMLIEGVAAEAAGRSIPELEAARDEAIIRVIAGRGEIGYVCG